MRRVTPADLGAKMAREQVSIYRVAAEVRVHPGRLGQVLRERVAMPADVAARLAEAIERGRAAVSV